MKCIKAWFSYDTRVGTNYSLNVVGKGSIKLLIINKVMHICTFIINKVIHHIIMSFVCLG